MLQTWSYWKILLGQREQFSVHIGLMHPKGPARSGLKTMPGWRARFSVSGPSASENFTQRWGSSRNCLFCLGPHKNNCDDPLHIKTDKDAHSSNTECNMHLAIVKGKICSSHSKLWMMETTKFFGLQVLWCLFCTVVWVSKISLSLSLSLSVCLSVCVSVSLCLSLCLSPLSLVRACVRACLLHKNVPIFCSLRPLQRTVQHLPSADLRFCWLFQKQTVFHPAQATTWQIAPHLGGYGSFETRWRNDATSGRVHRTSVAPRELTNSSLIIGASSCPAKHSSELTKGVRGAGTRAPTTLIKPQTPQFQRLKPHRFASAWSHTSPGTKQFSEVGRAGSVTWSVLASVARAIIQPATMLQAVESATNQSSCWKVGTCRTRPTSSKFWAARQKYFRQRLLAGFHGLEEFSVQSESANTKHSFGAVGLLKCLNWTNTT